MRNDKQFCGPLNMGNPKEFTILQLAQQIIALAESSSTICFEPLPYDDPKQRKPDITLAKERYRWKWILLSKKRLAETIKFFSPMITT